MPLLSFPFPYSLTIHFPSSHTHVHPKKASTTSSSTHPKSSVTKHHPPVTTTSSKTSQTSQTSSTKQNTSVATTDNTGFSVTDIQVPLYWCLCHYFDIFVNCTSVSQISIHVHVRLNTCSYYMCLVNLSLYEWVVIVCQDLVM